MSSKRKQDSSKQQPQKASAVVTPVSRKQKQSPLPVEVKSEARFKEVPESESEEYEEIEVEEEEESSEEVESEQEGNDEEDDEVIVDQENIKRTLQPFSKEQLINILQGAVFENSEIMTEIMTILESDPVQCKVFVFGLGWDATNDTLLSAFKKYGPVEDCIVITEKSTGLSKGYGFVRFKTRSAAQKALKTPQIKVGNRLASCQLASLGLVHNQSSEISMRKLYIANVLSHLSVEKLKSFFSSFGEIEEGPLGYDRASGKFKGYALIVYKTAEGIKKALEEPVKILDGVKLYCSLATKTSGTGNTLGANLGLAVGGVGATSTIAPTVVPSNIALSGLQMGLNPALLGQNLSLASAALLGQNSPLGVANNQALGLGVNPSSFLSQTALPLTVAGGLSQPLSGIGSNSPAPTASGAFGQAGVDSLGTSLLGKYSTQAALQGTGAFQSSLLGQTSLSGYRSGIGSTYPYSGR